MENGSKKEVMFERMREKKKEVKTVRKIVLIITITVLVIGLIVGLFLYKYITGASKAFDPESEDIIQVEIPIGSGLDLISVKLEEYGIVKDARLFKYYAKFNNEAKFQAGSYGLSKSMTPDEIIRSLKTGRVYHEPVFTMTIAEGLTLDQIGDVVEKKTGITAKDFLAYVNDEETIDKLIAQFPLLLTDEIKGDQVKYPLEGYLFPATYPFYEEEPPLELIVEEMLKATISNVTPHFNYLEEHEKTVHWLLTFASLLEREATAQADRATIASVFYNRLKVDMPLQTDPTVLYALGEHKSRVLFSDLKKDDPYNTYVYKGLPPGPIAGAGKISIEAVIDPAETKYVYFLADKDGVNHFADTYEEHLSNRAKYID